MRIVTTLDEGGRVRSLTLHGDRSVWQLPGGISLATGLAQLATQNGRPLKVHGFDGSERSGRVIDWGGGALAGRLAKVTLTFVSPARSTGYGRLNEQQKLEIEKSRDFSSSDPEMRLLDPWIETIGVGP